MSLRACIVLMSGLGVVSDAVLIGFYPQFFAMRYGVHSSVHVGAYVAAISIAVMCTLPLWARVARRVETMPLLLATQGAAGVLCLLSERADTVMGYWVLSLAMFMCKSSYLLMFPYLMRLEKPEAHASVIGLLSVVVHAGAIFGSVVGGFVLQRVGAPACLWLMAAGDFAQMGLCAWLILRGRAVRVNAPTSQTAIPAAPDAPSPRRRLTSVIRLSLIMLVFDFSAYLIRPFFSVYWESVAGGQHSAIAGLVFAIPGAMALLALRVNQRLQRPLPDVAAANLVLGAVGLLLQAVPHEAAIVLGRCLYGWSLFQVIVKLEVSLFKLSSPERYARDFGITNLFQNLGVLLSSFAAGALVQTQGIGITFAIAAAGLLLTALLDRLSLGVDRLPAGSAPTEALEAGHAT